MTLAENYLDRLQRRSDMAAHLPRLVDLARRCTHATEFGVRLGHSTIALLHGLAAGKAPAMLVSSDIAAPRFEHPELRGTCVVWDFRRADTAKLADIAETDLLFIDTLHTCAQVQAELRHHARVRRWIAFHDTITFGSQGEQGQPGITHAIYQFLGQHADEWRVRSHNPVSHGLLVLERIGS